MQQESVLTLLYMTMMPCIAGYVVQGSNGEYVYLRDEERVELVRRVAEMAASGKLIVAGAGCECRCIRINRYRKLLSFYCEVYLHDS